MLVFRGVTDLGHHFQVAKQIGVVWKSWIDNTWSLNHHHFVPDGDMAFFR